MVKGCRAALGLGLCVLGIVSFVQGASAQGLKLQDVEGTVRSAQGVPLVGAVVRVVGTERHAVVDPEGVYLLKLPRGEWKLECSYVGYQSAIKTVKIAAEGVRCDWELAEDEVEVREVLVEGEGTSHQLRKAPLMLSVANRAQFKGQVVTLQQMLTQTSGVASMRSGGEGYHSRILVQGLDGKRVGMFIDGMPVGSSEAFDVDRIPAELIERVEVYKGVVPPWLGGDGLSGAVNVVSRAVAGARFEAAYSIGSYASHKGYALGAAHFDKAGIDLTSFASVNYARNNYKFNSPFEPGRIILRDHDRFLAGQASVSLRFSKAYFDMLAISASYDYGYKEVQGGMMNRQNNVQHAFTRMQEGTVSAAMRKHFLEQRLGVEVMLRAAYGVGNVVDTSSWAYNFVGERYPTPGGRGEVGMLPNFSRDVYAGVNAMSNVRYAFTPSHAVHLNASYRYSRKFPHDTLAARYSSFHSGEMPSALHALVAGLSYELNLFDDALRNTLGVKGFYFHDEMWAAPQSFVLQIEPHSVHQSFSWGFVEALSWQPGRPLTLKASVQLQSRLPTSFELFGDGVGIMPGNALRPERSLNVNMGFLWVVNPQGYPHARIEGQGFYMKIRDLIKLTMGFALNMQHENIMQAVGYGADGEVDIHWLPYLSMRMNATYYRLENRSPFDEQGAKNPLYGMRVPNVPWLFGNVALDAHMENPFGFKSYASVYAVCQFTEEFSYAWELSRRNQMRVPQKWNLDAGLSVSFLGRYHLGFVVHNVLGAEQWEEFRYPLPGRTYNAKLRYTLVFDEMK